LLDWAAVAGRDIDGRLLVECGAVSSESAAADLIDQARRAGVVDADDLRFTHDLYREAILDAQPASTTAAINRAIGRALFDRLGSAAGDGGAARVAAHLIAGGAETRSEALDASLRAAREATARLAYDDACRHYERAIGLAEEADLDAAIEVSRRSILLELAAAYARAGKLDLARRCYVDVARISSIGAAASDAVGLARAALGMHELGQRSGTRSPELVTLLRRADQRLEASAADPALRARVLAALTLAIKHATISDVADPVELADRASRLARTSDDQQALALARLAAHDALWAPGSARARLALATESRQLAEAAGDPDLVARAVLLGATALVEVGDPAGIAELLRFVALADGLGHRRGRWSALTRRATWALITGRPEEAAELATQGLELGLAIGEPDAIGAFAALRGSLVALGVANEKIRVDPSDPVWPIAPLLSAWSAAASGDHDGAREALGDFSELSLVQTNDLEFVAVAAVVFAAVGSTHQRRWTYRELLPFAGTHVVVGGCVAYHAAVDHHLGMLAASMGELDAARDHLETALEMHRRLGAAGWVRVTERALTSLAGDPLHQNEFRRLEDRWRLRYAGLDASLPDAKGLRDLWMILSAKGSEVHVRDLIIPVGEPTSVPTGADPVLDDRARAAYRTRLTELAARIDEADETGDAKRSGRLIAERDAIVRELTAASGLGGRPRRLGDDTERARKTVSARVRDSMAHIDRVHPGLAAHLRSSIRLGTQCTYQPGEPTSWQLG
jgi:tetratricopeptide (TPR) repeat protein